MAHLHPSRWRLAAPSGVGDLNGALLDAIAIVLVSPGAWQVWDTRSTQGDEGYLLGFIQHRNDDFEVMQLAAEFRWSSFSTMDAAVTHIAESTPAVIESRRFGDLGWIMRASETTRALALSFSPMITWVGSTDTAVEINESDRNVANVAWRVPQRS